MAQLTTGPPAAVLTAATCVKSSYSNPSGNCVELAALAGGKIAIRHSRRPGGPNVTCSRAQLLALLRAVRQGTFDGPGMAVA
jgi:hypothetical protein